MQDIDDVILIQGDSLTLPREGVPYSKTWPHRLGRESKDGYEIVNISQSEKTTADLSPETRVHKMRELEYYQPRKVVIQLGIVDCAPRYFRKSTRELLDLIPVKEISGGIFFMTKNLTERSEKKSYVSEKEFLKNLTEYLRRSEQTNTVNDVIFVKILSASQKYERKNPNVGSAIRKYNHIIDDLSAEFECARSVRPLADSALKERELVDRMTLEDGYHLSADGHLRLYQRLRQILFRQNNDQK